MDKARFYFVDTSFFKVRIKFLHIVFCRLLNKYVKEHILDPKSKPSKSDFELHIKKNPSKILARP